MSESDIVTTDGGLQDTDFPGDLTSESNATNANATTSPSQFITIDSAVLTPSDPLQASPTLLNDIVDTILNPPATKQTVEGRTSKRTKFRKPKKITPKIFDSICAELTHSHKGIDFITAKYGTSWSNFWEYIQYVGDTAQTQYTHSRVRQYEWFLDQLNELEDKQLEEVKLAPDSRRVNAIQACYKLKVDNLKWMLSKLHPSKYGDRVYQRISDGDGNPLKVALPASVTELDSKLTEVEGKLNLEHN